MADYETIVIGGGIVGLALARELLRRHPGLRLAVLEKEDAVAAHQTGHNSGVIHSGVYYKPGSLKARLCIAGARALAAYCQEHGLTMKTPGKVIVAKSQAEIAGLRELERRGHENGVAALRWLAPPELAEIEPHVRGVAALHVPGTGIVDYAGVARCYASDIQQVGGEVQLRTAVYGFARDGAAIVIETSAGEHRARRVINCAGLFADRLAALAGCHAAGRDFRILPFRGEYYALRPPAAALLRGLVYPVPDPRFPFLGVHFTPHLDGSVAAGPSAVLAWQREGYRRSDVRLGDLGAAVGFAGFWAMAARYWRMGLGEQYRSLNRSAYIRALQVLLPALRAADVAPGGTGVRATVVLRNGKLMDDFLVVRHGAFTHVINVVSPAATASLAIASYLTDSLAAQ